MTVFVDFDGTLLDSEGCLVEAYQLLCENKEVSPSTEIMHLFDQITFEQWQNLIFHQLGECSAELLNCAKTVYSKRSPNSFVLSILQKLPADCSVRMITKEPVELPEYWLSRWGIKLFAQITTVSDERMNQDFYTGENILLIDDNYNHCSAAKMAGAYVIGVNSHHTEERKSQMREICDLYIEN